jgi:hypothetical protein
MKSHWAAGVILEVRPAELEESKKARCLYEVKIQWSKGIQGENQWIASIRLVNSFLRDVRYFQKKWCAGD